MTSFIRYIFAPKTIPIGSVWVHDSDDGNPFAKIKYKIVDVKNGFVQYEAFGDSGSIKIDSTPLRSFYTFFREIKQDDGSHGKEDLIQRRGTRDKIRVSRMEYEAELDIQIAALEKEIERRKRIRVFWEKSIPGRYNLLKKWKPMLDHMRDESNKIEVAINLQIMNVLLDKHKITAVDEEGTVKQFIMPIMAHYDKDGNSWK